MFLSKGRAYSQIVRCLSLPALALLWLSVSVVQIHAQSGVDSMGTGGRHKIQGRIYFPSGRRSDVASVKVTLDSTSSERIFVIADLNGSFAFNNLAPGNYTVTVEAGEEFEPAREHVLIEGFGLKGGRHGSIDVSRANVPRNFTVMISLQPKRATHSKPGVINAGLASVPKAAAEAYQNALAAAQAGDTWKAVDLLKAAISYYPEFPLALNELGEQYLKLGQAERALGPLQAALRIQPDGFTPRLNYGIALLESKNSTEAEVNLRMAVSKNDSSWPAHMYLGVALIALRKLDDAEQELLRSLSVGGSRVGLPHYWLGGIYWHKGEYHRAAAELQKYLETVPNAPNAERVRATIKDLRAKQSAEPEKP